MYVETVKQKRLNKRWNQMSFFNVDVFLCDECHNRYEKRHHKNHINNPLSTGSPFRPSHDDLSCAGQAGYRTTARQEGSWLISKPERDLVNLLKVHFGSGDIEQQKEIRLSGKKYIVDVYIKSRNILVQLDGEFWHGLDKPYDQLHPRSKSKFDDDRIQDVLFSIAGLNLVRITDAQLITWQKNNDFSFIVEKLGG